MHENERIPTQERLRRRHGFRFAMSVFSITMTLFYLGLGAFLLLDKTFLSYLPSELRNIFAVMVIVYGLYRGWRAVTDYIRT